MPNKVGIRKHEEKKRGTEIWGEKKPRYANCSTVKRQILQASKVIGHTELKGNMAPTEENYQLNKY